MVAIGHSPHPLLFSESENAKSHLPGTRAGGFGAYSCGAASAATSTVSWGSFADCFSPTSRHTMMMAQTMNPKTNTFSKAPVTS